jgi:hypothetical protein
MTIGCSVSFAESILWSDSLPGGSPNLAYWGYYVSPTNQEFYANGFSLAASGTVDTVRFYGGFIGSPDPSFYVNFYASDGVAGAPGTLLESVNASATTVADLNQKSYVGTEIYEYEIGVTPIAFTGGAQYYFAVGGTTANNFLVSAVTNSPSVGPFNQYFEYPYNSFTWTSTGGREASFALLGASASSVPEPATFALSGLCLVGLSMIARRRHRSEL